MDASLYFASQSGNHPQGAFPFGKSDNTPPVKISEDLWFTLPDGMRMHYRIFSPANPKFTVVVELGRDEFIELKAQEYVHEIIAMGGQVIMKDPLNQGRSDRFAGAVAGKRDHLESMAPLVESVSVFHEKVVLPKAVGPIFYMAHSLGAHTVVKAARDKRFRNVAGLIVTSPMWTVPAMGDISGGMAPALRLMMGSFGENIATMTALGVLETALRTRLQCGEKPTNPLWPAMGGTAESISMLSSCKTWQAQAKAILKAYPLHFSGPMTIGWGKAALNSLIDLHSGGYFRDAPFPVVAFFGKDDTITPPDQRQFMKHFRKGSTVLLDCAKHNITSETQLIRDRFWKATREFIEVVAPKTTQIAVPAFA